MAGSAIWALTQANNYATIARLYTGAQMAAQKQVDYLLNDTPFNPQNGEFGTTSEWQVGTSQTVPVYTELNAAGTALRTISGTMVTTVAPVSNPNIANAPGAQLNLYSATVVVTYNYRGKNYRVQLNAMRASDA